MTFKISEIHQAELNSYFIKPRSYLCMGIEFEA